MHDRPATLGQHLVPHRLRADQVAGEVHGEQGVPLGERDVGERAGAQDAGVVHQDIRRAEGIARGGEGTVDGCFLRDVAGDAHGLGTLGAQGRGQGVCCAAVAVQRGDRDARGGECLGDGAADAARRAGHDRDAARHSEPVLGHVSFLLHGSIAREARSGKRALTRDGARSIRPAPPIMA